MSSYEKALKKIHCDSHRYPHCSCFIIGPQGPTGPTGPTGPAGSSGLGAIIPFASGDFTRSSTSPEGVPKLVTTMGFGNSLIINFPQVLPQSFSLTQFAGNAINMAFVVPRNGVITDIWSTFITYLTDQFPDTTVTMGTILYRSVGDSPIYTAIPESQVNMTPFVNSMTQGETVNGSLTGLNIPVAAGDRLLMLVIASATGAELEQIEKNGYTSAGINIV